MRKFVVSVTAPVLALLAGAGTVQSQETGIAEIHEWIRIGRKTCMLDHFHYGNGSGRTRAEAQRAAIRSWAEFTAWEYGDPWGRYRMAASKDMNCSRESPSWTCSVEALPCRPY